MSVPDFRQLALAEMEAVHRLAFHLARRPDVAADLVQETYLRALGAETNFELRQQGIRPWLFKILHNVFYSRLEKDRREPTLAQDLRQDQVAAELDEPAPCWDLATLDWEQVDDRLKKAIDGLEGRYREVLLLWAIEGLKYREIADVLTIPLGTVMSRLYRARSILSAELGELATEHGISVEMG
ncbi:MAG: sigma-70 family RNA polymerase sigma factor [Phycisphaeraceae bacterium]